MTVVQVLEARTHVLKPEYVLEVTVKYIMASGMCLRFITLLPDVSIHILGLSKEGCSVLILHPGRRSSLRNRLQPSVIIMTTLYSCW